MTLNHREYKNQTVSEGGRTCLHITQVLTSSVTGIGAEDRRYQNWDIKLYSWGANKRMQYSGSVQLCGNSDIF